MLIPVYFVYKNAIRFVPERIKGEVQELLDLIELLESAKEVMNTVNNLDKEKNSARVMKRV